MRELLPGHTGLVETLQLDAANLSSNIQQQVRGNGGDRVGMHRVCIPGEMGRAQQGHGALHPWARTSSAGTAGMLPCSRFGN